MKTQHILNKFLCSSFRTNIGILFVLIFLLTIPAFKVFAKEQEKTREELVEERNEHIVKGLKDTACATAAAAGAAGAAEVGHLGLATAEIAAAAVEGSSAADEFKQAYECQKKINELDEQNKE